MPGEAREADCHALPSLSGHRFPQRIKNLLKFASLAKFDASVTKSVNDSRGTRAGERGRSLTNAAAAAP